MLAGVSVDYYTRLERGNLSGVSESVLEALARALQLDEAERAHLFDLARAAQPDDRDAAAAEEAAGPAERAAHPRRDDGAPAFVQNGRLDILAANQLGRALYSEMYGDPVRPVNHARFVFLDPRAHDFYGDWERAANDTVAILRSEAGRDPYDRDLSDLVGELSTRSETFRTRWAAHNVRIHHTGVKQFHHPVVGDLSLTFEMMELAADTGLRSSRTPPSPGRSPRRRSTSSRAGRRRSTRRKPWPRLKDPDQWLRSADLEVLTERLTNHPMMSFLRRVPHAWPARPVVRAPGEPLNAGGRRPDRRPAGPPSERLVDVIARLGVLGEFLYYLVGDRLAARRLPVCLLLRHLSLRVAAAGTSTASSSRGSRAPGRRHEGSSRPRVRSASRAGPRYRRVSSSWSSMLIAFAVACRCPRRRCRASAPTGECPQENCNTKLGLGSGAHSRAQSARN